MINHERLLPNASRPYGFVSGALALIGILCVSAISLAEIRTADNTLKGLRDKIQFGDEIYEYFKGPEDSCPNIVDKIKYEGEGANLVLRFGERIIFSNLAEAQKTEDAGDCKESTFTTIDKQKLKQVITSECKNPSKDMTLTQELRVRDAQLSFESKRQFAKGNTKNLTKNALKTATNTVTPEHFTCEYRAVATDTKKGAQ